MRSTVKDAWLAQLNLWCMVSLSASDNKDRIIRHFRIKWFQQGCFLMVYSKWSSLIYLVRCLKCLGTSPLQVAIHQLLPSVVFQEFRMYENNVLARLPSSTNFSDVWLTVQNSSGLAGGPWAINSPTPKDEGRWIQTTQAHHPACSEHLKGKRCLPGLPVYLWQLILVKATCASLCILLILSADTAV